MNAAGPGEAVGPAVLPAWWGMMRQDLKDRFQTMARAELPRLRRFALYLCGDVHKADDYVQGALERMYVAWPRVHDVSRPGAYLRAVLMRHALNERRRPWRREHCAAVLPEQSYETTRSADLGLDLARALAGLTTRQRAAVVLRYVEDRPVTEVAQIMGTTPGTVKRQCSDAVTRLRHILGEDFIDDGLAATGAGLVPELDLDETGRGAR
jgi:RNA polymerase sigma-70 factor (sigma-E family)